MTTEAPKTQKKPRKKRKNTGWVPDQHGAWVMVTVPLLLGVGLAGPSWIHLPLAVAWMTGYFAFFALGLWVKARGPRKAAFRRPLATYGGVSAAASIIVVAMHPAVVLWGVVFAPLVGVAVWEMYRRRPRSLLSGEATVLASCVMVPLASSVVGATLDARLWTITAYRLLGTRRGGALWSSRCSLSGHGGCRGRWRIAAKNGHLRLWACGKARQHLPSSLWHC